MTYAFMVVLALLFLGLAGWYVARRRTDVPCTLDLEATQQHFHAHVNLEGIEVEAGDSVLVHDAPTHVPLGTRRLMASRATVHRASWLKRSVVRLTGGTEFYELYDVGFEG